MTVPFPGKPTGKVSNGAKRMGGTGYAWERHGRDSVDSNLHHQCVNLALSGVRPNASIGESMLQHVELECQTCCTNLKEPIAAAAKSGTKHVAPFVSWLSLALPV
jgi:hypothetical protein